MGKDLLVWLMQSQVAFAILYGVWWLALRRLPFHALNRAALLSIVGLSVGLPLLVRSLPTVPQPKGPLVLQEMQGVVTEWVTEPAEVVITHSATGNGLAWGYWIALVVISLSTLRMLLLFAQSASMLRRASRYPGQSAQGLRYCYTEGKEGPSTFFHWIFLPQSEIAPAVLAHEEAHARQGHSWDILLVELWLCLFWWNPLAYAFRRSLRQVHEYLADAAALQKISVVDYLQTLVDHLSRSADQTPPRLAPAFIHASLTKRISMMKKRPTTTWQRTAYALLAFTSVALLWAFRSSPPVLPTALPREVASVVESPEPWLAETTHGYPLPAEYNTVTSGFGMRMHPVLKEMKLHRGIDLKAPTGTAVLASARGTVIKSVRDQDAYGHHIVIHHGGGIRTLYSSMDELMVAEGDEVTQGQQIGTVGQTGASTGPHLHFEIQENGEAVDPAPYLGIKAE